MDDREAHEFYKNPEHLRPAGPGQRPQRPAKSTMAAVRFTPEAIEAVKAVAHEEGMTVSSWIRRAVKRALQPQVSEPEMVEMTPDGTGAPVRLPADAVRAIAGKLMPILWEHGSVSLTFGGPRIGAERPQGLIPGSARMGEAKALRSSLSLPRTFSCPHMSIGNVVSAECGTCGPMRVAA